MYQHSGHSRSDVGNPRESSLSLAVDRIAQKQASRVLGLLVLEVAAGLECTQHERAKAHSVKAQKAVTFTPDMFNNLPGHNPRTRHGTRLHNTYSQVDSKFDAM